MDTFDFYGKCKQIQVYNTALSDSELARINNIMIFKKYEFTDKAAWETAKKSITTTDAEGNVSYTSDVNAVAEIGHICYAYDDEGNCENLSTLWSVDILWNTDSDKFSSEAVYPEA